MDVDTLKKWFSNWEITVAEPHFNRRAKERDRSTEHLINELRNGNIIGFFENPNPSEFVQYDKSVVIKIYKSSNYHYRIPTYIKENNELHLRSVWHQPGRR